MRRFYLLTALLGLGSAAVAQSSFSDDFESYTLGAYVAQASPNWTTWSGASGGPEDAQVVNTQASSGTQSIRFFSTSASGGPQDLVLPFGGAYTTGTFTYEMDMYVPASRSAYFNFQATATIGQTWAMDAYFNSDGTLDISNTNSTFMSTTYPQGAWFTIRFDINLNTNNWEVFIDNVSQGAFANTVNSIASIDLYPVPSAAGGTSEFWVDDVSYTHTPYTLPALNAAVVGQGTLNPATRAPGPMVGLVGQQRGVAASVRNLGMNAIASFDISYTYNGNTFNQTVTGVNIPSLGSYVVEFTTPTTLISGTNPLAVTVSNVNGLGNDGDPNDDTGTSNVNITTVPAAGKMVVGEEATGTWCQWCPRGAIFMDYMAENYSDYFAGIAIHNADPMVVATYDTEFSQMVVGYPSVYIDRMVETDPGTMEADFLSAIANAPTAVIVNGANWNAGTRVLDVSLSYTFSGTADDNWRVACVLVEDSVTGTSSGYSQSNAYGNNGAGPMGGFENLGTIVPAAQMNYNHVARALSPDFFGYAGFPSTVSAGSTHTFNFSFTLDPTWDENEVHIIGMLITPGEQVDNGSSTSIADAVANGFVPGTLVVGTERPAPLDEVVTLYPNPAHQNTFVRLNLTADTDVQVTLRDVQGRSLGTRAYGMMNGGHVLPIQTQNLAAGLYHVEVRLNDEVVVRRLVVE